MMTHSEAQGLMQRARSRTNGKPIAHNTRLFEDGDGGYRIRFHATDIITVNEDGTYTLANGGYNTVTTLQRLRQFSPGEIFSERGEWYVWLERRDSDPRPERVERSIPKPYTATDPGPEPVKSADGCIANTFELHERLVSDYSWRAGGEGIAYERRYSDSIEPLADLFSASNTPPRFASSKDNVLKLRMTGIYWGESSRGYHDSAWGHFSEQNVGWHIGESANVLGIDFHHVQCPHCKAFEAEHERWHLRMYDRRWGVPFDQQRGYAMHAAMLERFGSMEAWQEAYIADFRARRAYLQAQREWEQRNRVAFFDGITVNSDGYAPRLRANGPSPAKLRRHEAKVARTKKRIDKFVDGFIAQLRKGMPMPSNGDCWYCLLKDQQGQTWGDHGDHDHLWSHMRERYYVPSLLTNAMLERGMQPVGVYLVLNMNEDTQTMGGRPGEKYDDARRYLRSYLNKRLIPAAPTE